MLTAVYHSKPLGPAVIVFFFNDTATTEIYTLSLHDALPILVSGPGLELSAAPEGQSRGLRRHRKDHDRSLCWRKALLFGTRDRKSTRLNSSHANISYAVFCLKKKRHDRGHDCGKASAPLVAS